MRFSPSQAMAEWHERVKTFINDRIVPALGTYEEQHEASRWQTPAVVDDLKAAARVAGLWNLFMPPSDPAHYVDSSVPFEGPGLSNLEYAPLAEEMGRIDWSSEIFNCSAPDTGNMEVLLRYGNADQKREWMIPLMRGEIRSAFLMTEPGVASSDATNIETSIRRDGESYVINGRKWWSSGAGDPRCRLAIVMGKSDPTAPKHLQQSQVLVPMDTPGLRIVRMLPNFGFDGAPHGHAEIVLEDVRVPAGNMILGEGRGFEIAQGRLGPGRIHHCMRAIGTAEAALESMARRLQSRVAFGKQISDHSVWEERVAHARVDIEMSRLLCLKAAYMMDTVGSKGALAEIAMIKVVAPRMALKIIDDAIQAWGGAGVSDDPGLTKGYSTMRALRIADGPDEVHNRTIARLEFRKYSAERAS